MRAFTRRGTGAVIVRCFTAVLLVSLLGAIAGCSEQTRIITNPPGAKVTVNGRLIGVSPCILTVRRDDWPEENRFVYVIERDGFATKRGEFRGVVTPGHIIGAVTLTAGLSLIWQGVYALPRVEVDLEHLGTATAATGSTATTKERLQRIDDLFDQGLITEQ